MEVTNELSVSVKSAVSTDINRDWNSDRKALKVKVPENASVGSWTKYFVDFAIYLLVREQQVVQKY